MVAHGTAAEEEGAEVVAEVGLVLEFIFWNLICASRRPSA
jgi:hypothetical protein